MSANDKIKRLTRSLSAPRRCNSCRKMVYFTALRCKDCGNVTHESCATDCAHQCPGTARRRSYQPSSVTGADSGANSSESSPAPSSRLSVPPPTNGQFLHPSGTYQRATPSKTLRILSHLPLKTAPSASSLEMNGRKSPKCSPVSPTSAASTPSPVSSPGSGALTISGLLKVVHWLSQRRRSRDYTKANLADKHAKSKFGLTPDTFDEKVAHKRLKSFLKTAAHKRNSIAECGGATSYYHPPPSSINPAANYPNVCPCGRLHDHPPEGVPQGHHPGRGAFRRQTSLNSTGQAFFFSPNSSVSSSGCFSSASSAAQTPSDNEMDRPSNNAPLDAGKTNAATPSTNNNYRTNPAVVSFMWNELSNPGSSSCAVPGMRFYSDRTDSTTSRLTVSPISSIVSSEVFLRSTPSPVPELLVPERGPRHHSHPVADEGGGSGGILSQHGRFGRHCFSHKARTFSIETGSATTERLCSTWPPAGKGNPTIDELQTLDDSESGIGDCEIRERKKSRSDSVKETLGEWCIPYNDLEFKECLVHGINGDIFRGQWHGEVLIYKFDQSTDTEVQQFLEEVAQLCMIRHENILLFMGACIEPPHLAIITSMRKGPSLHEQIHLKRHTLPMHTKFSIVRQVAQGMSYLHAKGILHRKLSSRNIILESRVKICIMDQAVVDRTQDRPDFGCTPRGYLCYLSPELMQSVRVEPPRLLCVATCTRESDVYSFGTLLYEILTESYPFTCLPTHSIIWQIGVGKHATVNEVKCTSSIRTLLLECWETNPTHRPSFSYINRQLQENVSLHRRHSSSEPERLNRAGLQTSLAICA